MPFKRAPVLLLFAVALLHASRGETQDVAVRGAATNALAVVPAADGFLGTWVARYADGSTAPLVSASPDLELESLLLPNTDRVELVLTVSTRTPEQINFLLGWNGSLSLAVDGVDVAPATTHTQFRRDQRVVDVTLPAGAHSVSLRLQKPPRGAWRISSRVFDATGRPGLRHASLELTGIAPSEAPAMLQRQFSFRTSDAVTNQTLVVTVHGSFRAGQVLTPCVVEVESARLDCAPRDGASQSDLSSRGFLATESPPNVVAYLNRQPTNLTLENPGDIFLLAAANELRRVPEVPPRAVGPVAWRIAELERMIVEDESDGAWRELMRRDARSLAETLRRGRNPFESPRGYQRMGFVSRLDDTAQPYELFVPPAYRDAGTQRWPLLVTLHGHSGNAGDYFRNTFGLSRPNTQTLLAHGRHGVAPTTGPMFVVGPTGRGQSQYRYAGEEDILEVMHDVMERFRIDPSRIYITGGSMGGTGAAYLPFRHPGLFAASAALAGYHDQRVRSDTHQDQLGEIETFLRAERSDVDWAVNARHLPMLLIRGTMDVPLAWTTSLADRLNSLGYRYEHRQPISRHNVWTENYADGAIFRWFQPHRRAATPSNVRFVTARERHQDAYWVTSVVRDAPDAFARVDAMLRRDDSITVTTEHVESLSLSPEDPGTQLRVNIDGQPVEGASPLRLLRATDGTWRAVDAVTPHAKRAHVSGPIRDVYNEPLLFVVGTADPAHLWANELVAHHWANPLGWTMQYPIVHDVDVTDEMIRTKTLVLIGPPQSNTLLRRFNAQLPIQFRGAGIQVGATHYSGPEVGTVFVAPNPEAPDHSLLVIAGSTPFGTWRSVFLPDLLPDYVVFNEAIADARDTFALGGTGAEYLSAGFFDMEFRIREP